MLVRKRDGRIVDFEISKIERCIMKAAYKVAGYYEDEEYPEYDAEEAERLSCLVAGILDDMEEEIIDVTDIQDVIERVLILEDHVKTATEFITYRANRDRIREMNTELMKSYESITFSNASDVELKRENANIDGDSAMGTMLRYGSEGAKKFNLMHLVSDDAADAHKNGDIHIHDLDFLALTTTCCQIDIETLFNGGFNTGHGSLREPGEIRSYSALACIAIQANQNDQHKRMCA